MIIYLRFQLHVSFPYFHSHVLAVKTSSAYSDTLTGVDRVDFRLVGDKHETMEKSAVAWLALPPETSGESTRLLFYLWLKKLTGWLRGQGKTCSREFFSQTPKMRGRLMAGKVTLQIIILFQQVIKGHWQTLQGGGRWRKAKAIWLLSKPFIRKEDISQ